ncbi:uncharacterized protein LOC121344035 [Onychostruthus taczanowskii]|uniref:uncharacterized protein LOC121344035 n=1 Tax=Onychostruthus taczanowskii TaxID=356909 RepID=UPI001B808234|nr:uncharacterized protein LOC121344035 [Onychostruthus taczanowskii]
MKPITHLQSVLAGTVAGGKRSSHDAHDTAHSDNLPFLPLDHVVQDILCQGDGAQVVELNDGIVDIQNLPEDRRTNRLEQQPNSTQSHWSRPHGPGTLVPSRAFLPHCPCAQLLVGPCQHREPAQKLCKTSSSGPKEPDPREIAGAPKRLFGSRDEGHHEPFPGMKFLLGVNLSFRRRALGKFKTSFTSCTVLRRLGVEVELGDGWTESCPAEKDLRILMSEKLDTSQQYDLQPTFSTSTLHW